MEAVGEPSRPRPSPRTIDNGKSSSNSSAASERIIPITVLGSRHNNDENDNTSLASTPSLPASKRLSAHEVPIEAATNPRGALYHSTNKTSDDASSDIAINNNFETTKRHSLLVTLDDGSTTQTHGSVTKLKGANEEEVISSPEPLSIEEIGQDTLMREMGRRSSSKQRSPSPPAVFNTPTSATSQPHSPNVRVVPIKLSDGKVTQVNPGESIQIRTEYTNYTHQEFNDSGATADPEIPRMDGSSSGNSDTFNYGRKSPTKAKVEERIVPIKLLETGETIMPSFTTLEDPQPPEWSTFHKSNKAKERQVPLKVETNDSRPGSSASASAPSPNNQQDRGRERSKTSPSKDGSGGHPTPRSSSAKNKVRFDLNDERQEQRSSSTTTERRSSSVETVTRKTTTSTTSTVGGKPPSMPRSSARPSTRATPSNGDYGSSHSRWRTQSAERPSSATPIVSPGTERTLQEIDRDINQIWRELQELEKLPNGTVRARTPPARTPPPPRPASAGSQLPIKPVKVTAGYVNASPKYSTTEIYNRPTTPTATGAATPPTRSRTIWDMDKSNSPPTPPRTTLTPATPILSTSKPSEASPKAAAVSDFKASVTSPIMMRPPPPPIPPHLRPSTIKMAPIARDESLHDLGESKSPSTISFYDNEYSPSSGKFKGFPYIDGAPPNNHHKTRRSSKSPTKDPNSQSKEDSSNNFSVLVDKSTQTQDEKLRSTKDACAIL